MFFDKPLKFNCKRLSHKLCYISVIFDTFFDEHFSRHFAHYFSYIVAGTSSKAYLSKYIYHGMMYYYNDNLYWKFDYLSRIVVNCLKKWASSSSLNILYIMFKRIAFNMDIFEGCKKHLHDRINHVLLALCVFVCA